MNTATDQWPRRHLITVEEYQRMGEAGVLAPDARVELIDGEIIDMAPIGTGHAYVVNQLTMLFAQAVTGRAWLSVQQPIQLGPRSQPQPDFSLAKLPDAKYRRSLPQPEDLLLVVEVSDTTLRFDRQVKSSLYASFSIPEMWLIDVNSMQLHCMRQPQGKSYAATSVFTGGRIDIAALPRVSIELDEVLLME